MRTLAMKKQLRAINISPLILLLLLSCSSVKAELHGILFGCWRVKETPWFRSERKQGRSASTCSVSRLDMSINVSCKLIAFRSVLLCFTAWFFYCTLMSIILVMHCSAENQKFIFYLLPVVIFIPLDSFGMSCRSSEVFLMALDGSRTTPKKHI